MARRRKPTPEEAERAVNRNRERKAALAEAAPKEAHWRLDRHAHPPEWDGVLDAVLALFAPDDWLNFMKTEARISVSRIARDMNMDEGGVIEALTEMNRMEVLDFAYVRPWGDAQRVGMSGVRNAINAPSGPFQSRRSPDGHWWDRM